MDKHLKKQAELLYSKEHRTYLDEAIDAMETGKRIVSKTMAELEAMERIGAA